MKIWKNTSTLDCFDNGLTFTQSKSKADIALIGGKPIDLKSSSLVANYPGPKYKKVSFSNPGHAENLVKKLNVMHKTDKFAVYFLKTGQKFTR